jgi:hypothetical protein
MRWSELRKHSESLILFSLDVKSPYCDNSQHIGRQINR